MTIQALAATAIFAEDLRQEASGQVTIVGVLPDNLEAEFPQGSGDAMFPKLSVYTRTMIDIDKFDGSNVRCFLQSPSGNTIFDFTAESAVLLGEAAKGKAQGASYLTVIHQAVLTPFNFSEAGRYSVVIEYAGQTVVAGSINMIITRSKIEP